MSTRAKELIAVAFITLFTVVFYIAKVSDWGAIEFSTTVSVVVIGLLLLSLAWILILTIKGRLIERRVVFMYVGVAVSLPLFMQLSQQIPVSTEVRQVHEAVIDLQPGSKVLIAFDYDPPSAPELQPMAEAFIRLCFQNDLKIVVMGLWPQGPQQANLAFEKVLADGGLTPLRAHVQQVHEEVVRQRFRSLREHPKLGITRVSIEDPHPTDEHGHFRSRKCQ